MISIPIAVHDPYFEWQLDLFWAQHKNLYGDNAYKKAFAVIVKQNFPSDPNIKSINWDTDIPHQLCKPFFRFCHKLPESILNTPLNIQLGLRQILHRFKDDDILEVLDCDMFHMRQHPVISIPHGELLVCDLYEKWHLRSLTENKFVIKKYVGDYPQYYNGGFVPIVGTAKTFKLLLQDWINIHLKILKKHPGNNLFLWWAGMFALNASCELNNVKMIAQDHCYIPSVNQLNDSHYVCHYSVDNLFKKREYPNLNFEDFPDSLFYNLIKTWHVLL